MPSPARRAAFVFALALPATVLALASTPPPAPADGIMLVRAGAFWMGRDGGGSDEAPLHRVFVRDVWIERHKVTNAEFAAFLDARGPTSVEGERRYDWDDADARVHTPPGGRWAADPGFEHHPAVEVSWFGARDFCAARGRRLPSEAEWEKAGRGDDRRIYPWGGEPPGLETAVFARRYNATEPTAARPRGASPHGVEDLLGNLREWTSTALRPYPYRPDDGREPWPGTGRVVVRGASHDDGAATLSLTRRTSYDRRGASAGHHHVGFRCATSEDLGEMAPGRR